MTTVYVDASGLLKLIVDEPGALSLRRFLAEFDEHLTSRVGIVETRRALARASVDADVIVRMLAPIAPIEFDASIASTAAVLEPATLRTLDAIHLASSLALYHVDAFVTYDDRLAAAARAIGLPVASPS